MVPNGTAYSNFPPFATNGTKTPPGGSPESAKYALGMVPADTFPAEWANYLFHGATAGITRLNQDTGSIKKEINSVLTEYNITPDATLNNQLVAALAKIRPQPCECTTASATAAKSVALQGNVLKTGNVYLIAMTNGNTAANPTLSFNGGTAYPICDADGKSLGKGAWSDGDYITVIFTGTKYLMLTQAVANEIAKDNKKPVTSNAVACIIQNDASFTLTGPTLGVGGKVKILFTSNIYAAAQGAAAIINYNGTNYNVKIIKAGTLQNFTAYNYTFLQGNTILDFVYDGTSFIIQGNPVIISTTSSITLADGLVLNIAENKIENSNQNAVTVGAVSTIIETAGTGVITGPTLGVGGKIKVLYTVAVYGATAGAAAALNYNGTNYPIKVNINGTLQNYTAKGYMFYQENTAIDYIFDGTNFITQGNPAVITDSVKTIYADGTTEYKQRSRLLYQYASGNIQTTVSLAEVASNFEYLIVSIAAGGAVSDFILTIENASNKSFNMLGWASGGHTTRDNLLTYICEGTISIINNYAEVSITQTAYNDTNFTPGIVKVMGINRIAA